ncbi:alkaline phosphatase D family protein [Actinomadura scrupuli]|uniref:alkaline phosphatase D family protein n=1 Tax=Actinomadura scrupuli TaxID=559629 RepID=UPI003D967770
MSRLVLGPLLRHVGERTATIWVETDRPCEVRVTCDGSAPDATARTFTLHDHHYALVEVEGLEPGSATPYRVSLDDETVWPEPGSPFPDSRLRTLGGQGTPLRLTFGSCRVAPASIESHGIDALSAFAHQLAAGPAAGATGEAESPGAWPSVLLMLGDQVYADSTGQRMRDFIRGRRDLDAEPYDEIADFEEYTELYRLAWGEDPAVRWLLSTLPTLTIFDDHDIRDDWNTSYAWRQQIWAQPWWRRRIVGGIGSYWVYQHLGNLSPSDRAADPLYATVREGTGDAGKAVDEFAERADKEPASTRWSYAHDFGGTRLIVIDSRCSRLLTADRRAMLDDEEQAWFDAQCTGGVDHLLIASSLPYLLPPAIHHAESWNEAVAGGAWGRRGAAFGEKVRQAADLEHWAAFENSFRTVAEAVSAVARGERGTAPATIAFLSGDVHYSYLAKVRGLPIYQVVCSPMRNPLVGFFRWANVMASWRAVAAPVRLLAKLARVPRPALSWRLTQRPTFDNALATVWIDGRHNSVHWNTSDTETTMSEVGKATLA